MKPRTKKILFAIIGIVLICVSISVYRIIDFRKEFVLSSSITVIENGEVTTVDFATGEIRKTKLDIENLDLGKETVFADGGDIYTKENGTWVKIFSSEFEIEEKPIIIGDSVFFVAEEPDDLSDFPDNYLWKYQSGNIEKVHYRPIVNANAILPFDDKIFFAEKDYHDRILLLNTTSGKTEEICYGANICWKEEGKSFFYQPCGGGLAIFDLGKNTSTMIDENVYIFSSPLYNSDENVLLMFCDDGRSFATSPTIQTALYFLDSKEKVPFYEYFWNMGFGIADDRITGISKVYWN